MKVGGRSGRRTIDLSLLRQPPSQHLIDSGDVLAIYIEGVIGKSTDPPPVYFPMNNEVPPSFGLPFPVRDDGSISLPMVGALNVRGLTITQAEQKVTQAYLKPKEILNADVPRVQVNLQRPRQYRVLVIRQDSRSEPQPNAFMGQVNIGTVKRGTGKIVNLPAYSNDVLNALTMTDGLPGLDAENAVYVIRRRSNVTAGTIDPNWPVDFDPAALIRQSMQREAPVTRGQSPSDFAPQYYHSALGPMNGNSSTAGAIQMLPPGSIQPPPVWADRAMALDMPPNGNYVSGASAQAQGLNPGHRSYDVGGSYGSNGNYGPNNAPMNAPPFNTAAQTISGPGAGPGYSDPGTYVPNAPNTNAPYYPPQSTAFGTVNLPPEYSPPAMPSGGTSGWYSYSNANVPMAPGPTYGPSMNMPATPTPLGAPSYGSGPTPINSPVPGVTGNGMPLPPAPAAEAAAATGAAPGHVIVGNGALDGRHVIRIPIRLGPGETADIRPEDVVLYDGDIVFIESRETEVFYTAGLLGGGQYTLPRDYDLDILQALSMAQSRTTGMINNAVGGVSALNSDVAISPSTCIVLRKLPDGSEVPIKVDLYRARTDLNERIVVQPGDFILLQYTPLEAVAAFFERHLLETALFSLAAQQFNRPTTSN